MQYKIPVQIENEDPIIFNLSIRQLLIILVFSGAGYGIFQGLSQIVEPALALIPAIMLGLLGLFIAIFKLAEMSFIEYVFAILRRWLNATERVWVKGVDSFSALDIGYITADTKKTQKVDFGDKMDKMKNIDEQLKNI